MLVSLISIWVAAKVCGQLAARLGQPEVLGELVAGVIVGPHVLGLVPESEVIGLLAQIGVILLLFEIGLQTDLTELVRVGPKAAVVAVVGMVAPMAGGYGLCRAMGLPFEASVLVGAALTATSIAVTTRTLRELGKAETQEGRIVVGAAVVDDVLGLVILGVVVQLSQGGTVPWHFVVLAAAKAVGFVAGAVLLGNALAGPLIRLVDRMTVRGALVTAALVVALACALLAQKAGSAAIIGAFAAGMVLARTHRGSVIEDGLKPVATLFIPVFFVTIGGALDLKMLNLMDPANRAGLLLAAGVLVVAVVGKLASGFAAWGKGLRRLFIGASMVPRGEVVLVFAGLGRERGILDQSAFAVLIVVVFATAFATPVVLGWLARKWPPASQAETEGGEGATA